MILINVYSLHIIRGAVCYIADTKYCTANHGVIKPFLCATCVKTTMPLYQCLMNFKLTDFPITALKQEKTVGICAT